MNKFNLIYCRIVVYYAKYAIIYEKVVIILKIWNICTVSVAQFENELDWVPLKRDSFERG